MPYTEIGKLYYGTIRLALDLLQSLLSLSTYSNTDVQQATLPLSVRDFPLFSLLVKLDSNRGLLPRTQPISHHITCCVVPKAKG